MNHRTEQETMNNIYSGWEKYKETQNSEKISKALDQEMQRKMMEANGLKPPLNESEKVQAESELIANALGRFYIQKASEQLAEEERIREEKVPEIAKKRRYRFYIGIALLASLGTAVLCRDKIGGVVKDVVETVIDYDNQKLDDEYEDTARDVQELTGMTPEEIMNKGKSH